MSGIRTVPQIFFKNEFWGGADKTIHGYQTGDLQQYLRSVGVSFTEEKEL